MCELWLKWCFKEKSIDPYLKGPKGKSKHGCTRFLEDGPPIISDFYFHYCCFKISYAKIKSLNTHPFRLSVFTYSVSVGITSMENGPCKGDEQHQVVLLLNEESPLEAVMHGNSLSPWKVPIPA